MALPFNLNPEMLSAISQGLLSGRTGSEQLGNAMTGALQAKQGMQQRNKTLEFLAQSPEISQMVEAGVLSPQDGLKAFLTQQAETRKAQLPNRKFQTLPDGTYGFADENAGTFTPMGKAPKAGVGADGAEYGLNPQYGVDAEGNPVILQLSKSGTSKQTALPDGVRLSKEPIRLDAGTHFVLLDPITRQPIGQIAKNVAGEARATAEGKAGGEASAALPAARSMANTVSQQIKGLRDDPYLPYMVGPRQSKLPNITADAARVQSKMDQVQGDAFLQGRQLLKGGGAITDFESAKAEAAIARLNAAQRIEDYKAALDDFNAAVQEGVRKLEAQARGGAPAGGQADPLGIR